MLTTRVVTHPAFKFQDPITVESYETMSFEDFVRCSPFQFTELFQKVMVTDGIRISSKGVKVLSEKKFANPMANYFKKDHLGAGRNGSVHEYFHKGQRVAVKVGYHEGNPARIIGFLNEAVNHFIAAKAMEENVIGIQKVIVNKEKVFFVLERGTECIGSLAKSGSLDLNQITKIVEAFSAAIDRLHSMGISHNDIKSDNILGTEQHDGQWALKIIDFGASRQDSAFVQREANASRRLLGELLNHYQNRNPGVRQPTSPDNARFLQLRETVYA